VETDISNDILREDLSRISVEKKMVQDKMAPVADRRDRVLGYLIGLDADLTGYNAGLVERIPEEEDYNIERLSNSIDDHFGKIITQNQKLIALINMKDERIGIIMTKPDDEKVQSQSVLNSINDHKDDIRELNVTVEARNYDITAQRNRVASRKKSTIIEGERRH
jgi:hypothetical protein